MARITVEVETKCIVWHNQLFNIEEEELEDFIVSLDNNGDSSRFTPTNSRYMYDTSYTVPIEENAGEASVEVYSTVDDNRELVYSNKDKEEMRRLFTLEAIDKMLEIAGHDVRSSDLVTLGSGRTYVEGLPWYQAYTMTTEQREEWKLWFITTLLERELSDDPDNEFDWFNLSYGLKIDDKK